MSSIVNLELLRHPFNWIVVAIVLLLWAFALRLIVPENSGVAGLSVVA